MSPASPFPGPGECGSVLPASCQNAPARRHARHVLVTRIRKKRSQARLDHIELKMIVNMHLVYRSPTHIFLSASPRCIMNPPGKDHPAPEITLWHTIMLGRGNPSFTTAVRDIKKSTKDKTKTMPPPLTKAEPSQCCCTRQ